MDEIMALLVIDPTNDFCPGGALPVPDGDKIIPVVNQFIADFAYNGEIVVITKDEHPPDSKHFEKWPKHGIKGTRGARFHRNLNVPKTAIIIRKGMSREDDGYSAFEGVNRKGVPLLTILKTKKVTTLVVGGLATDYCVKASVLDAIKEGFKVKVIEDGIRAVNVNEGDGDRAIQEMKTAGAEFF